MRTLLLLMLCLALPSPASAQAWNAFAPCEEPAPQYLFRDVCSPAYLRRVERAFHTRPLAHVAGAKRAVRVVVIEGREYRDGVSQFVIMIDAVEQPDGAVRLIVRTAPQPTRRARLAPAAWNDVATLAASLENAPGVGPWRGDLWIHPAEFVVQTQGFGASRTLYTTMAEGGPAQDMVALMLEHTTAAFARCDAQDSPWTLRECLQRR